MFSLTICFGPTGTVWQFLFKERTKAQEWLCGARCSTSPPEIIVEDDYGQSATIVTADIHGVLLEDLAAVETARIQRSLADERCKAKFIKAATDDPVIKSAMRQQGPSVLTPMGASGFR